MTTKEADVLNIAPARAAFALETLEQRCLAPIASFAALPRAEILDYGKDGTSYFIDNGAQVLAVAHLDTVNDTDHFHLVTLGGRDFVFSCQLDDRLGVYFILDWLPALLGGRPYDILLTTGEEAMASTAQFFDAPRDYHWMFECDRGGLDTVGYQYTVHPLWERALRTLKIPSGGEGSYSDIAELTPLEVLGWNFGVGYQNAHALTAHVDLIDAAVGATRAALFINRWQGTHFPFFTDPAARVYAANRYWGRFSR